MKFLGKNANSQILAEGLTYQKNRAGNNNRLKELLLKEQKKFCAYTEKYIQELDSSEVEHFNSTIKYTDNYYNYYAVIRKANQYKKDEKYKTATFFHALFFQNKGDFNRRVKYIDGTYEEIYQNDIEAKNLIDFLGFNHPNLFRQRQNHINRLKGIFEDAKYDEGQRIEYFRKNTEDISFVTAIEIEFNINLSEFYE